MATIVGSSSLGARDWDRAAATGNPKATANAAMVPYLRMVRFREIIQASERETKREIPCRRTLPSQKGLVKFFFDLFRDGGKLKAND
jgi:hypothetical protein